jgi:hypothetical protein
LSFKAAYPVAPSQKTMKLATSGCKNMIPLRRVPLSVEITRPRIKGTNEFRPRKSLCILNAPSITDPTKGGPLGAVRLKP